jgi:hypothetical protein
MQDSSHSTKVAKPIGKSNKHIRKPNLFFRFKAQFILSFIFINIISFSSPIFNSNFIAKASPIQDKGTTPSDWASVGDDNGSVSKGDDLECAWASTARIFCKVNQAGGDNKNKQASFFYDPEISSQVGHTVFASNNPSEHGWIHFFDSNNGDILGSFNIINRSGTPGHEVDSGMGIIENNITDEADGSGYNTLPENDHDSSFKNANYCSTDKFKDASDQNISCVLGAGAGGRAGRSITVASNSIVKSGLNEANNKKNFDKSCQDNGGVLGFFLCPFIELMKQMIGWLIGGDNSIDANGVKRKGILISLLEVQPLSTSTGLYNAWNNMRDIASGIYIIVFLMIIMGNIFSFGVDNYTAKKLLPKLIIAAILTNLSWIICSLLIDIFNILGNGIADLIFSSTQCNSSFCSTSGGLSGASMVAAGITSIAAGGAIIGAGAVAIAGGVGLALIGVVLIFLIGALASTIGAIGAMFVRHLIILGLVFVSPIAFALMVLPGTNKFYKKWWENLFKILIMYPLVIGLLSLSLIFADLTAGGTRDNMAGHWQNIIAEALPFFALMMIPKCFKWGGSILSSAGGAMAGFLSGNAKKLQGSQWAKDLKERRKLGFSDVGNKELDEDAKWQDRAKRKIGNMGSDGGFRDTNGMPFRFENGRLKRIPPDQRMPHTKNAQRRATARGRKETEYYKEYESLETSDLRKVLAGADNDMQKAAALTRLYEKDKGLAEDVVMGRKPIIDGSTVFWGDRDNEGNGGKETKKGKRKSESDEQISKLYFGSDEKIQESSPHLANKYQRPNIDPVTKLKKAPNDIALFSLKNLSTDKIGKLDGNFWQSLFDPNKTDIWARQLEAAQDKDPATFGQMDTTQYARHLLAEMDEDTALAFVAANHQSLNGRTIQALWKASEAAPGTGFNTAMNKVFEDTGTPMSPRPEFKSHHELSKHLYRFNRQDFAQVNIPGFGGQSFSSPSQYTNTTMDTRLGAGSMGVDAFMSIGGNAQDVFGLEELMTINDDSSLQHKISGNVNFTETIEKVKEGLAKDINFTRASTVVGSKEFKIKKELDNIVINTSSTGVKSVSFTAPAVTRTFRTSVNVASETPNIVRDFNTRSADEQDRIIKTMNYQDMDRISHMVKTGIIDKNNDGAKEMARMIYDRQTELMTSDKPEDIALLKKIASTITVIPPVNPSGSREFLFE